MHESVNFSKPEVEAPANSGPDVIVLKLADSTVPVFKESKGKDYIKYGDDNMYPEYLTYLFNKSAKHNAILTIKAAYVFGNGYENGDIPINRLGETLNDISKKCILDTRIYGGFRLEIIWGFNRKISEIYHVDYSTVRKGKEGGFYWKETWQINAPRTEEEYIPPFNPQYPVGSQLYEYNEYRPGTRFYPLPDYIGSNNYIETDIEISIYYLSSIRNGMMPSKMIQFYSGDVTDEKKKEIEQRWTKKFAGAGNAGRFVLVFNAANAAKGVEINDLSANELDKHFQELNKTTQQEIYAGHNVTSPMLFGIKTEGQLGGSTELATAYSIFQNTYSKPKAKDFDKELNYLMKFSNWPGIYELQSSDPIGLQFDVKDVVNSLPKQFVFESLGIPKDMWELENIGADNRPSATIPIPPAGQVSAPGTQAAVNDNIKNLTGKQKQNIDRIVRQYENEKHPMNWAQAAMMLKKGYGLDDEDVIAFLGTEPQPVQMSSQTEDTIIEIFDQYGHSKNDFEILKSKKVSFSAVEDAEQDEVEWQHEAFKNAYDVTPTEAKILELIKKDPLIEPQVLAEAIGETKAYVQARIDSMVKRGYIESAVVDGVVKRTIPDMGSIIKPPVKKGTVNPTQIYIKYSYEGPQDNRNRPFCAKLLSLHRLYSRQDIEQITQRLGYSVFDRRGGFWTHPDGVVTPYCRHHWQSNLLVKKGGEDVA